MYVRLCVTWIWMTFDILCAFFKNLKVFNEQVTRQYLYGTQQIVQHGGIFAEWAFGTRLVDQEVKMKCCHGDQGPRKHQQMTKSSVSSSLSFVLFFFYPLRFLHTISL